MKHFVFLSNDPLKMWLCWLSTCIYRTIQSFSSLTLFNTSWSTSMWIGASILFLSLLSKSKLIIGITSKSKFRKGLSLYNLERSIHDQAGYFLKIAKKCLQTYPVLPQPLQEHFGIEQVLPKHNSYCSL